MHVLLDGCPVFRQFTQLYNRISLEISDFEDVIDRIYCLSFGFMATFE